MCCLDDAGGLRRPTVRVPGTQRAAWTRFCGGGTRQASRRSGLPIASMWEWPKCGSVPVAADPTLKCVSAPLAGGAATHLERLDPQKPVEMGLVRSGFLINCGAVWLINLSYLMQ